MRDACLLLIEYVLNKIIFKEKYFWEKKITKYTFVTLNGDVDLCCKKSIGIFEFNSHILLI